MINFICISKPKDIFNDLKLLYLKRIKTKINFIVLKEQAYKNTQLQISAESALLANYLSNDSYNVVLDIQGEQLNLEQIATKFTKANKPINLFIGGPYGISEEFKNKCDLRLSLGLLTYPHQLVLILALEQIYRYECHEHHHPYDK
jgi:23S rRNA (pseudouridine1915-N3)-methyltransferase